MFPKKSVATCAEPMHIVHGRTGSLLKGILWAMRFVFANFVIVGISLVLFGTGEDSARYLFALCCCTSFWVFVFVRSVTGARTDIQEVYVGSWVVITMAVGISLRNLFALRDISGQAASFAIIMIPTGMTTMIVLQSYLEICGMARTRWYFKIVTWCLVNTIAAAISLIGPVRYLTLPWLIVCPAHLVLMLLAHGFIGHISEWERLSSELLESAFDATFLIGAGEPAFVETSSQSFDNVFHRGMQGCALDETIIIHGAEAAEALCKSGSSTGSEPSDPCSGSSSDQRIRHAFVTCRDAQGWEFDAELRTSTKFHNKEDLIKRQLCGMIVFGEKRPPAHMMEERPQAGAVDICPASDPAIEPSQVRPERNQKIRSPRGAIDGKVGRTASRSLPSIPEDDVSLLGPGTGPLGSNVDSMLAKFVELRSRDEGDQWSYRMFTYLKRSFSRTIQDNLVLAEAQIRNIQRKSEALLEDADSLELRILQQDQMQPELPEVQTYLAQAFATILNYSLQDHLAPTQDTERPIGELGQERTHPEPEIERVPHVLPSVAVNSTSVTFTTPGLEIVEASDSFLKLLGPCNPGLCLRDWTSKRDAFNQQLAFCTNTLLNSFQEQVSFTSPWSLQSPFLKRSGTRIECTANTQIFDSLFQLEDDDEPDEPDEQDADLCLAEDIGSGNNSWKCGETLRARVTLTDIRFVPAVAPDRLSTSKKLSKRPRGTERRDGARSSRSGSGAGGLAEPSATGIRQRAQRDAGSSSYE